jgi:hypothetical protein
VTLIDSLVHPVQNILKSVEPGLPEFCHLGGPVNQRAKGMGECPVMGFTPAVMTVNQTSLFEDAKVLRNNRLGNPCLGGQPDNSGFSITAKMFKDRSPCGIAQSFQQNIGCTQHYD